MGLFGKSKKEEVNTVVPSQKQEQQGIHTVELNKEQELIYKPCVYKLNYYTIAEFIKTIFNNVKEGGYLYIPVCREGDNIRKSYIIKNIKQIKIDTAFCFIITGTPTDILYSAKPKTVKRGRPKKNINI